MSIDGEKGDDALIVSMNTNRYFDIFILFWLYSYILFLYVTLNNKRSYRINISWSESKFPMRIYENFSIHNFLLFIIFPTFRQIEKKDKEIQLKSESIGQITQMLQKTKKELETKVTIVFILF